MTSEVKELVERLRAGALIGVVGAWSVATLLTLDPIPGPDQWDMLLGLIYGALTVAIGKRIWRGRHG